MVGQDADLARWLRKHCSAPVLLAANKAERRGVSGVSGVEAALTDATRLGFGDPIAISAESGQSTSCYCTCISCTVNGLNVSMMTLLLLHMHQLYSQRFACEYDGCGVLKGAGIGHGDW